MAVEDSLLDEIERELSPPIPHDTPTGPLHHYTDAAGFQGIVGSGFIWATHYGFLNDSEEFLIGERLIRQVATDLCGRMTGAEQHFLREFLADYDRESLTKIVHVCVASFSEHGDHLSQWRAYAAGGGGYSIGFSEFPLPDYRSAAPDANLGLWLVQCVYDKTAIEHEARQVLSGMAGAFRERLRAHGTDAEAQSKIGGRILAVAMRRAATIALRLKHEAFREEQEWRLIVLPHIGRESKVFDFRPSPRGLVPYVPLDLRFTDGQLRLSRVYVGPTQHPGHGRDTATLFLSRLGLPGDTLVEMSTVPFRGNP